MVEGPAPYRFVPLNADVVETPLTAEELRRAHDLPLEGGLDATLTVEWAAETPLLIGTEEGGEVGPMKMNGEYVIPGASLRGMLRAVMEIACFARLRQINGHHRYALRDFDHDHYKEMLLKTRIDAGWLRKDGERWIIRPCEWKPAAIDGLTGDTQEWLNLDRFAKFSRLGMASGRKDAFTIDFTQTMRLSGAERLRPDPRGEEWRIVVSGKAVAKGGTFAKKVEYGFRAGAPEGEVEIHPDAWRDFVTVNSKPAKNRAEPAGAWAEWQAQVAAGLEIPVFYSGDPASATCAIGLTRLFRLPSKRSVAELRDKAVRHRMREGDARDMVEALFGHVDEPGDLGPCAAASALRSRIRFGFARLVAGEAKETKAMDAVMMGPRASFAPYYLAGAMRDWSDGESWLAGRKRYPVRFDADRGKALEDIRARFARSTKDKAGKPISDGTQSRLRLLVAEGPDELVFRGEIRLHNVKPEELGAVIWALRLGETEKKTRRHALGRGKAFGCGQMRVRSVGLRTALHDPASPDREKLILSARKSDRPAEGEHWMPPKPAAGPDWESLSPFQRAFSDYMAQNAPDWGRSPTLQALFAAANPARGEALRRADLLNYPGETGAGGKTEDGYTAHMALKKRLLAEPPATRWGRVLPWALPKP